MKTFVACSVAVCLLTFVSVQAQDAKFDPAGILGGWTYVEGTKAGTKIEKDKLKGEVKFAKDTLVVPGEAGGDFKMSYKIDATKSPATIDITIDEAPFKEAVGSKAAGLVAIDGDTLKLIYIEGATRPKGFESTAENKAHYFILKKSK